MAQAVLRGLDRWVKGMGRALGELLESQEATVAFTEAAHQVWG